MKYILPINFMGLARTFLHTIIIFAIMHLLGKLPVQRPGFDAIIVALSPGAFLPFAASTAAGLNNHKSSIYLIIAAILVGAWPYDLPALARLLIPVAAGIIAGTALRSLLREQQEASCPPDNHHSSSNTKTPAS